MVEFALPADSKIRKDSAAIYCKTAIAAVLFPLFASTAMAKIPAVHCDRVTPLDAAYSVCHLGENEPTDADMGLVFLVDRKQHLRLAETNRRYTPVDPKSGKSGTPFAVTAPGYYTEFAGQVRLIDGRIMEFYVFDRLGHSNMVYFLKPPDRLQPVPDGNYTLATGKTVQVKYGYVDGEFDPSTKSEVHYPYDETK